MAQRSRLAGFIIDCQVQDLSTAAAFWSQALGYDIGATQVEADAEYTELKNTPADLYVEVQKVGHPSRVHVAELVPALKLRTLEVGGNPAQSAGVPLAQ